MDKWDMAEAAYHRGYAEAANKMLTVINQLTEKIEKLKAESKKGEWSKNGWGNVTEESCCPFCGKGISNYVLASETWMLTDVPNYCPNCGADMRGENE